MTINVGIDYSLTSPCMCVMSGPSFDESTFFYLTNEKRYTGVSFGRITGDQHASYLTEQERYDNISTYFMTKLKDLGVRTSTKITIEDYSFGSKGRVFNLAENCGLLKHKLWIEGYIIETVPPTVLKKFATGKGNANKEQMYTSFVIDGNPDINAVISPNRKGISNPVSDIVDSYYLALFGSNRSCILP
jgi:Holliday junction resolvasome RuvABC endonuclease subunit